MIDSIAAVNGNFSCGKEVFVCYKQAGLATALAEADISLFALSTYDTDYVLVKSKPLSRACMALNSAGYILENG